MPQPRRPQPVKRPNGQGTINPVKRPDGSVAAYRVFWFEGDPVTGLRVRRYRRAQTRGEAEQLLADALAGRLLTTDAGRPAGSRTLGEALTMWLGSKYQTAPKTRAAYGLYASHLTRLLGSIQLDRLQPRHVDEALHKLETGGMAPETVRQIRGAGRNAVNWAIRQNWLQRNVFSLSEPIKVPRPEPVGLEVGQLLIFLQHAQSHQDGPIWLTAFGLGLRMGEALGIRWSDLDLESRQLRLVHQAQRDSKSHEYVLRPVKTTASRRLVALPDFVVEALRRQNLLVKEARLRRGRWHPVEVSIVDASGDPTGQTVSSDQLVFTSPNGRPIHVSVVHHRFQRALKDSGLPAGLHPHDLRDIAATSLEPFDASGKQIQAFLGHSRIQTTYDRYMASLASRRTSVAGYLDQIVEGLTPKVISGG